jgi:chaperone BCS1
MTTNHPENLDAALIRPGRVDKQVEFKCATQGEAKRMFERMYASSTTKAKEVADPTANETANGPPNVPLWRNFFKWLIPSTARYTQGVLLNTGAALNSVVEHGEGEKPKEELSDELSQTAEDFAAKVPGGLLSPAEIQGFLLKRKNDPRKALDEVGTWVEAMKEAKEKGSKLLQVQ